MLVSLLLGRRSFYEELLTLGVELKQTAGIVRCSQAQPASLLISTCRKDAQDFREMLRFISS